MTASLRSAGDDFNFCDMSRKEGRMIQTIGNPLVKHDLRMGIGSGSDWKEANFAVEVFQEIGVDYGGSILSCHRNIGGEMEAFLERIPEWLVFLMGGMEFALPGIMESIDRNAKRFGRIILAVPLDQAARSAIENLPIGTAILTCGLNEKSVRHSIVNSALMAAKLLGLSNPRIQQGLQQWYDDFNAGKPLVEEVSFTTEGFFPKPQEK